METTQGTERSIVAGSKEQYQAALNSEWEAFKNHCDSDFYRVLPMTLAKDTAIHMAVYSGSKEPLEDLLDNSPFLEDDFMTKNAYGNTAVHVAAVTGNLDALRILINQMPNLLQVCNNVGETPLFKAAAFGRTEIVKFIASRPFYQISEDNGLPAIHRQRPKDKTSILHIAVEGEHFETALELLRWDTSLRNLEDKNGMTCLQLLANMPSAFKSGYHMGILKAILYLCLPIYEHDDDNDEVNRVNANIILAHLTHLARSINLSIWRLLCLGLPMIKSIRKAKEKHEFALKLAKELIKEDISWENEHTIKDSSLYYSSVGEDEENDQNEKRMHEFALKFARFLMKEDISWITESKLESQPTSAKGQGESQSPISAAKQDESQLPTAAQAQGESQLPTSAQEQSESQLPISPQGQEESQSKKKKETETPLLLATRHGIIEIVREILKEYPQAVEHCSHMGQNILHVAVKHRHKEIFDHVKRKKIPMSMLVRGIDSNGHTILHHAAELDTKGTRPGPALQLQAELQWFKRVQKIIPTHYSRHVDGSGKTAAVLFKENHADQLTTAQEWIKGTSQSCSAVAVLIATVVFAAAYTVPGGSDNYGVPVFLHSPFFLFFTIMDVVSLASSLTSVVMFLSILTSPCEQKDFLNSLPQKLMLGFTLLFFSVTTTMLAFAATIVLIIRLNQQQWTTTLIYVSAFFPVTVFALMQFPLYAAFMSTLKGSFKKVRKVVSRLFCKKKFYVF